MLRCLALLMIAPEMISCVLYFHSGARPSRDPKGSAMATGWDGHGTNAGRVPIQAASTGVATPPQHQCQIEADKQAEVRGLCRPSARWHPALKVTLSRGTGLPGNAPSFPSDDHAAMKRKRHWAISGWRGEVIRGGQDCCDTQCIWLSLGWGGSLSVTTRDSCFDSEALWPSKCGQPFPRWLWTPAQDRKSFGFIGGTMITSVEKNVSM